MARPFAARLLAWYDASQRDLPWRGCGNPWAIWVSEIMLQQTRVEAVRPIFTRFIDRYPRPSDFASVSDDELLTAWSGLGYYRRARLLRDGARVVAERHDDAVPADLESLGDLPGVGAYTRGAVASIAFDLPVVAIDGNVERVFARHGAIRENVKCAVGAGRVRAAVERVLDAARPGDFNQAVMELGATICTPRSPRCASCPIASDCAGVAANLVAELPVLPPRRRAVEVNSCAVVVPRRGDRILGWRIPDGEINAGQIDLPGPGALVSHPGDHSLGPDLLAQFGIQLHVESEIGSVRHTITHHRIVLTAHWGSCHGRVRAPLVSRSPSDPEVPWTSIARKVFALAFGLRRESGTVP